MGTQMAPKSPQSSPKAAQGGPKRPQGAQKAPKRLPKAPQSHSKEGPGYQLEAKNLILWEYCENTTPAMLLELPQKPVLAREREARLIVEQLHSV